MGDIIVHANFGVGKLGVLYFCSVRRFQLGVPNWDLHLKRLVNAQPAMW